MKMYNVTIEAHHKLRNITYLMHFVASAESKNQAGAAVQKEHDLGGLTILSIDVSKRKTGNQTAFLKAEEIVS
jgi:hypothetical protein